MNDQTKNVSRRQFMQDSTKGLVALSSVGMLSSCPKIPKILLKDEKSRIQTIPKRELGKTGLKVSVVSFGGGSHFCKNEDGKWESLLERAIELGINFFDTSPDYVYNGVYSEKRFGEILPKYRDKIILSTKINYRDADGARREFEESLERLKTSYVDVLMIHGIRASDRIEVLEKGVYKEMMKLKDEGAVKFIGFASMSNTQETKAVINALEFDVVLLAMNPTKYGDFAEVVLPSARKKNIGILAMKVMKNLVGTEATAKELLYYALTQEGVASGLIAHFGMDVLEENVRLAKDFSAIKKSSIDHNAIEKKLAHLAGPHALCWARPDYRDGILGC